MKVDRHDQAKTLSSLELSQLFTIGLKLPRDRVLFGLSLHWTRIVEACSLHAKDGKLLMAALDRALLSAKG